MRIATIWIACLFFIPVSGALAQTGRIQLEWEPSPAIDLCHYNIYRSLSADGPFQQINTEPVIDHHYFDNGLANSVTFHYRITAVDQTGNESEFSNLASATTVEDVTEPLNMPPIAEAGDDQRVGLGATVTLDGSASLDPDGEIIAWFWIQLEGPEVQLDDETSSITTFVAPRDIESETLAFELVVWDDQFEPGMDQVNILVDSALPMADAGPDQNILSGAIATLDGRDSVAPAGSITAWHWRQVAGPTIIIADETAPLTTFQALERSTPTTYTFELQVWDNHGESSMTRVSYLAGPRPPVVDLGPDLYVRSGEYVILDGSQTYAPDGRIIAMMWSQSRGPSINLTPLTDWTVAFIAPNVTNETTFGFVLDVWDNHYALGTDEILIHVAPPANQAPVADAGADLWGRPNEWITLDGSGSFDPDGDPLTFQWRQTAGASVELQHADTDSPVFRAPNEHFIDFLTFELTVSDGRAVHSDTVQVTVQRGRPRATGDIE